MMEVAPCVLRPRGALGGGGAVSGVQVGASFNVGATAGGV